MNELFRFVLMRPANLPEAEDVKPLTATFLAPADTRAIARRKATEFVRSGKLVTSFDRLAFRRPAVALASALAAGPRSAADAAATVQAAGGVSPADLIADPRFAADEQAIADSLVATKLLSSSEGTDAAGLAMLARGYDAIRLAAGGRDPIRLRTLSLPDSVAAPGIAAGPTAPPRPIPPAGPPTDRGLIESELQQVGDAIESLSNLPPASFHVEAAATPARPPSRAAAAVPRPTPMPQKLSRTWLLGTDAVAALPSAVRETLTKTGADVASQPLTALLTRLYARQSDLRGQLATATLGGDSSVYPVGNQITSIDPPAYIGQPSAPMPTTPGTIRPVGVGDLMMVKQHVLRYEGGELAHVENVLKTEKITRETRRLDRTETTVLQETENTTEQDRDTQTTDRFSLQRETDNTVKTDASFKAGLSVDSKYGPTTEVKANADVATSGSSESSARQASDFSKDVVDRSVSKVVQRVLERRTVTTLTEFEEKYSHGFDNTGGAGHISGMYQWIDQVMQAQVYRYGMRMLFDVTVPEPSTDYILAQTGAQRSGQELVKPLPFTLTADQLTESNYTAWARQYDVVGLEPPPAPVKTITWAYDAAVSQDPHESSKSEIVQIDDGYQALYALFTKDAVFYDNAHWRVMVGAAWFDGLASVAYAPMAREVGSVAVASDAYNVELLAATVEVFCTRTDRAFTAWQLKTHGAIVQGYQAKLEAYREAISQAQAQAGAQVAGRNPLFNQRIIATELRKQALTLLTAQQFDAFGALEQSPDGHAQPNLAAAAVQMPYVRFFEQAFEWEHLVYFFYPYFWGWKPGWNNRMLIDDVDPAFADFLRAGAARIVFPVRPGFEAAVIHYLETGEIWNGGPPPDISSSMYVPIVTEIQEATGAPAGEQPVGDPWEVRLPTTLVHVRPNDDLPAWQKVGETWEPAN